MLKLSCTLRPARILYIGRIGVDCLEASIKEEMAERDDWVVTVGKEMARKDDWVVTIKDELQRMDTIRTAEKQHWDKRSIYRIPASVITDLNMKAYKPQFVSFGPYHHGEDHLKPMEEHKHRALLHFLKRSYRPLESYLNALAEVAQSLKDSYESLDLVWESDTDRFLRMMILDGCFMLEVLHTQTADQKNTETVNDYVANDPIFSNHGKLHIVPYVRRDMLMLENQLPMLLLTTLLAEETKQDEEFVNKLILQFFFGNTRFAAYPMGKCLHLLDVHMKILLGPDTRKAKSGRQRKSWWRLFISSCLMGHEAGTGNEIIRSAMEINEAGISFKKSKSQSLRDISFEGGKLRLPPIMVDDTTESMFLNLIALERFHVGVGNAVTAYIFFMDSIINGNAKNVSLLHDEGIIQNAIGSDKAVAEFFNSIAKDATLDPASSLNLVLKRVDEYCKHWLSKWRSWLANLKHTYFTSPWSIFSLAAAILLFVLTLLQTIFTIWPSK